MFGGCRIVLAGGGDDGGCGAPPLSIPSLLLAGPDATRLPENGNSGCHRQDMLSGDGWREEFNFVSTSPDKTTTSNIGPMHEGDTE